MTHSKRAKANMTKQIRARLTFLKSILLEKQKTVTKTKKFAKYHLPGYSQMLRVEIAGVCKVKKDIINLKKLIKKRYNLGQINYIR